MYNTFITCNLLKSFKIKDKNRIFTFIGFYINHMLIQTNSDMRNSIALFVFSHQKKIEMWSSTWNVSDGGFRQGHMVQQQGLHTGKSVGQLSKKKKNVISPCKVMRVCICMYMC